MTFCLLVKCSASVLHGSSTCSRSTLVCAFLENQQHKISGMHSFIFGMMRHSANIHLLDQF